MLELKAKVGSRGQVVIPKPIRELLQIRSGEEVFFRLEGDDILVRKAEGMQALEDLLNCVAKKRKEPRKVDWDEMYYSQFSD